MSGRTWELRRDRYGDEQMIDVIATVGNYHLVAFLLNSLDVQLDDGAPTRSEATRRARTSRYVIARVSRGAK